MHSGSITTENGVYEVSKPQNDKRKKEKKMQKRRVEFKILPIIRAREYHLCQQAIIVNSYK